MPINLFPYQQEAVQRMKDEPGFLLCDQMGEQDAHTF